MLPPSLSPSWALAFHCLLQLHFFVFQSQHFVTRCPLPCHYITYVWHNQAFAIDPPGYLYYFATFSYTQTHSTSDITINSSILRRYRPTRHSTTSPTVFVVVLLHPLIVKSFFSSNIVTYFSNLLCHRVAVASVTSHHPVRNS